MSRETKLHKEIESYGYTFDRKNSKQMLVFVHPTAGELLVGQKMTDSQCSNMRRRAQQLVGVATKDNKRNPEQIKERRAQERAHRLLVDKLAQDARNLADARARGDKTAVRHAERAHEQHERELRNLERLMQQIPGFR